MFAFSRERFVVRERERERKVKKKKLIESIYLRSTKRDERGDGGERSFVCEVFLIGC